MLTVAELFAEFLHSLGIRRLYGLPGEDHIALLDAMSRKGLYYCTAFNESAAVIMAATEAQVSGLPGVAILSLAPGVSNGLNGLLNTYMEQVPLLLVSGQHQAARLPLVVRQGFDIDALVAPATKWRAHLTADMDISAVLGKAVDEAMSAPPGPVYLELPESVATAATVSTATVSTVPQTSLSIASAADPVRRRWASRPMPAMKADESLVELFALARRPVVVLGGRRHRVQPETMRRIAETLHVPVLTSSRQMGMLDSSCPYYAGTFLNGTLEGSLFALADLVLLVDPEAFDFYNRPWTFEADAIAITDESFTEWINPFARRFVADPEATIAALAELPPRDWTAAEVGEYRRHVRQTLLPDIPGAFSVAVAVETALRAFPTDGYLVADAGFSKPLVVMLGELARPDHFFASNALSTMGYGIPAAMALRRAGRGPILAFVGDGSLLMRATELMAGGPDGSATVFVAMMDRALTQIEVKQERRDLVRVGVQLPPVSCAKLADTFGLAGIDVHTADELATAAQKALGHDGVTLIGALVDPLPSRNLFEALRG